MYQIAPGLTSVTPHLANTIQSLSRNKAGDVIKLPKFKFDAILTSVSKLPSAMGMAFKPKTVRNAFVRNGQIDPHKFCLPSIDGLIGTYRGYIGEDHYLANKEEIVMTYYEEIFRNSIIKESSHDLHDVPEDTNSKNEVVPKPQGISQES